MKTLVEPVTTNENPMTTLRQPYENLMKTLGQPSDNSLVQLWVVIRLS